MTPLVYVAAAAAALLLANRYSSSERTVTHGPVTLEAGVAYRVSLRINVGSATAAALANAETTARASLTASGGREITVTRSGSALVISYRAVPPTTMTYDVGAPTASGSTILSVTRLDGLPIR